VLREKYTSELSLYVSDELAFRDVEVVIVIRFNMKSWLGVPVGWTLPSRRVGYAGRVGLAKWG
jgi:hypothetical protein